MKKFKDFIAKKTDYLPIPEVMHFKMGLPDLYKRTKEGHVIIQEPIHFKSSLNKTDLKENDQFIETANNRREDNRSYKDISEHLHNNTASDLEKPEHKQGKASIKEYTEHDGKTDTNKSWYVNKHLIDGSPIPDDKLHMHKAILKHAKSANHEVHVYSGSIHDFSETAKKSKDHILHSPAHISASHNPHIAVDFASGHGGFHPDDIIHINHIHIKPTDKVLHVSKYSDVPHEHETVIPSGTHLKYHGSTVHVKTDPYEHDVHEHHFTIHKQN